MFSTFSNILAPKPKEMEIPDRPCWELRWMEWR